MSSESTPNSRAEIVDEVSKWAVGGGIVIVALFPLALPILILTAVAVLPLLLPVVAAGGRRAAVRRHAVRRRADVERLPGRGLYGRGREARRGVSR